MCLCCVSGIVLTEFWAVCLILYFITGGLQYMSALHTLPHTHTHTHTQLYLQLLTQEPGRYYLHLLIHIIECCSENKFICCDCTILCNPFHFLSFVSLLLPTRATALLLWIPYIKFLKEKLPHYIILMQDALSCHISKNSCSSSNIRLPSQ